MHVAELLDRGADDVTPKRDQVVALVEDDRPYSVSAEHVQSLAGAVAQKLTELEIAVLRSRDLVLEGGGDSRKLAFAPGRSLARPGLCVALDRLGRLSRGLRSIHRPATLREISDRDCWIVEASKSLVRQTRDCCSRVSGGKAGLRTEEGSRPEPLRLNGRVRDEYERPLTEAANDLHPEQRLARPRRRNKVRSTPSLTPVLLECLEGELLVPPPFSGEPEPAEVYGRRGRGHVERLWGADSRWAHDQEDCEVGWRGSTSRS